jgi:hypothetical protein
MDKKIQFLKKSSKQYMIGGVLGFMFGVKLADHLLLEENKYEAIREKI